VHHCTKAGQEIPKPVVPTFLLILAIALVLLFIFPCFDSGQRLYLELHGWWAKRNDTKNDGKEKEKGKEEKGKEEEEEKGKEEEEEEKEEKEKVGEMKPLLDGGSQHQSKRKVVTTSRSQSIIRVVSRDENDEATYNAKPIAIAINDHLAIRTEPFTSKNPNVAVSNLLRIRRGTMVGIMGPSGAGKSLLLNALAQRSEFVVDGTISYNAADTSYGYVPQDIDVWPFLTVRQS